MYALLSSANLNANRGILLELLADLVKEDISWILFDLQGLC